VHLLPLKSNSTVLNRSSCSKGHGTDGYHCQGRKAVVEEDAPEPTRRRVCTERYRAGADADASMVPPEGDELKAAELRAARDRLKKAGNSSAKKQTELEELDSDLGPITKEEFVEYGKGVAQAAFEYKKLLQVTRAPGTVMTDLMRAKRAFQACKLFDPLYLATDQPMRFSMLSQMIWSSLLTQIRRRLP
jgi:hypothetical protein